MTNWRLHKFVNEESSRTLTNFDVVAPVANKASPVVTHLARHGPFSYGRVLALHPSGCVCLTAVFLRSGNRYVWTGCTIESIPSILKAVPLITSRGSARETLQPGRVVQRCVRRTFRGRYKAQNAPEKPTYTHFQHRLMNIQLATGCMSWDFFFGDHLIQKKLVFFIRSLLMYPLVGNKIGDDQWTLNCRPRGLHLNNFLVPFSVLMRTTDHQFPRKV